MPLTSKDKQRPHLPSDVFRHGYVFLFSRTVRYIDWLDVFWCMFFVLRVISRLLTVMYSLRIKPDWHTRLPCHWEGRNRCVAPVHFLRNHGWLTIESVLSKIWSLSKKKWLTNEYQNYSCFCGYGWVCARTHLKLRNRLRLPCWFTRILP